MTLDEIFEKYTDDKKIYRISRNYMSPKPIAWAKLLKEWGKEELRKEGFWMPEYMVEDANANDWQIYDMDKDPEASSWQFYESIKDPA